MADLILTVQKWCRQHGVPYLHGCVWDRECRSFGASPCIYVFTGRRRAIVFELPLPFRGFDLSGDVAELRWMWNRAGVRTMEAAEE